MKISINQTKYKCNSCNEYKPPSAFHNYNKVKTCKVCKKLQKSNTLPRQQAQIWHTGNILTDIPCGGSAHDNAGTRPDCVHNLFSTIPQPYLANFALIHVKRWQLHLEYINQYHPQEMHISTADIAGFLGQYRHAIPFLLRQRQCRNCCKTYDLFWGASDLTYCVNSAIINQNQPIFGKYFNRDFDSMRNPSGSVPTCIFCTVKQNPNFKTWRNYNPLDIFEKTQLVSLVEPDCLRQELDSWFTLTSEHKFPISVLKKFYTNSK